MKALSIRAPWWWFILYAGKDIENRTWRCHRRGPIAIHASKWWSTDEVGEIFIDVRDEMKRLGRWPDFGGREITLRQIKDLGGHVVGNADITGCVQESDSPWFMGPHGIVLSNARSLETPYPAKGKLGFFDVSSPSDSETGDCNDR